MPTESVQMSASRLGMWQRLLIIYLLSPSVVTEPLIFGWEYSYQE